MCLENDDNDTNMLLESILEKTNILRLLLYVACMCVGGLGTFENNPLAAGPSLTNCVAKTIDMIPEGVRESTRLFLGATAGMRLLQ